MKKLLVLIVLLAVSSAILQSGCKKKEEETPTPTNIFTAKIDGVPFTAAIPLAQMGLGMIQIGGMGSGGSMQVILNYQATTGTYIVTDDTEEAIYWSSGQDSYWPGTGSIVVTKHDVANNKIIGTFTATLEELSTSAKINITNGVFNLTYVKH